MRAPTGTPLVRARAGRVDLLKLSLVGFLSLPLGGRVERERECLVLLVDPLPVRLKLHVRMPQSG